MGEKVQMCYQCREVIAEGEKYGRAEQLIKTSAMGEQDEVIAIGAPAIFHEGHLPRGNPRWRVLPD